MVTYWCIGISCNELDDDGHCDYRSNEKPTHPDDWIDQVMEDEKVDD